MKVTKTTQRCMEGNKDNTGREADYCNCTLSEMRFSFELFLNTLQRKTRKNLQQFSSKHCLKIA